MCPKTDPCGTLDMTLLQPDLPPPTYSNSIELNSYFSRHQFWWFYIENLHIFCEE